MPTWKERLRNLSNERRAYIIVMFVTVGALYAILRWSTAPTALEFKDVTGDSLQDLFLSLLLITAFKERAQEIYAIAWRAEGRAKRESDVKRASSPAAAATAEYNLSVYRAVTGRYVSLVSLCSGIFISLAGVRVLAPLVNAPTGDVQQSWLFVVDVLLTAGLLAGGSKLIHEVMAVVSKGLGKARGAVGDQAPAAPAPAPAAPAPATPAPAPAPPQGSE